MIKIEKMDNFINLLVQVDGQEFRALKNILGYFLLGETSSHQQIIHLLDLFLCFAQNDRVFNNKRCEQLIVVAIFVHK